VRVVSDRHEKLVVPTAYEEILMKKIIAAALAFSTMSTAVLAQQPAAPAATAPAATAASGADATMVGPGITMGVAATMPLKTVEIKSTDLVTSKLVGLNIYNKENEEVGKISDIVIGDGKSVIGVIASVGGFLGIGASYVVIDPASLALADDNGTWKAYVDTNKDDLSKAPKFDYDKMKK
jgi:hypothetical protein